MAMPKKEKPIRKVTLKAIIAWGMGGLFVLGGFIEMFTSPLAGIFTLLAGTVIFPPTVKLLRDKARLEMSLIIKVILFFIFMGISGAFSPKSATTPTPTQTPSPTPTPVEETIVLPTNTPNPDTLAGAVYTDVFLNNVYPLMMSANQKVTNAGNAGANYDFGTAKTEIAGALLDFNKAQNELRSIKKVPAGLSRTHSLITSALEKYIDGTQTVQKGLERYNADLIAQGTEIYSQGTDLVNQATVEIKEYTASLSK